MDDDEELIRRYLSGDMGAFDEIYRRHSPVLYAFILQRLRDRSRADDALQEVFIRVISGIGAYRHEGRFRAWLYRVAHNATMDQIRSHNRTPAVSLESRPAGADDSFPALGDSVPGPETDRPDHIAERREAAAAVNRALALLPAPQREVFLMRHAGLSFREIARIQECPINTALGRMHDAVNALRRKVWT